ncbi:MAG: hypothetical protein ACE5G5_06145 [Candidatus Methylomirabilales bacterium]
MKKGLMIAGLLVVGVTLLGMPGSALAEDHVCYEQSAPMDGMTRPGMVGLPHAPWGEMGQHQIGLFHRPITLMLERQDDLKLRSEQVAKLETLRASFQKKAEEGSRTLQERYGELREILGEDRVDLGKAEATLKTIAALRTDIALKRIEVIEEGKSVLTDEQWTALKDLRNEQHCPGMKI